MDFDVTGVSDEDFERYMHNIATVVKEFPEIQKHCGVYKDVIDPRNKKVAIILEHLFVVAYREGRINQLEHDIAKMESNILNWRRRYMILMCVWIVIIAAVIFFNL